MKKIMIIATAVACLFLIVCMAPTASADETSNSVYYGYLVANNGTDEMEGPMTITEGDCPLKVPTVDEIKFTYAGHVPVGFNTQADGEGDSFAFGGTMSYAQIQAAANDANQVYLYVMWEEGETPDVKQYTVKFKSSEIPDLGTRTFSSADSNYTLPKDEDFNIDSDGVYVEKSLETYICDMGDTISTSKLTPLANEGNEITLWVKINGGEDDYKVAFLDKTSTLIDYDTFESTDKQYTLPTSAELGVEADGFYTSPDFSSDPVYEMGQTVAVSELIALDVYGNHNVLLYLNVEPETITGYLHANNGASPETVKSMAITAADCPIDLAEMNLEEMGITNPGYSAISLNTSADGTGTSFTFDDMIWFSEIKALSQDGKAHLYVIWVELEKYYDIAIEDEKGASIWEGGFDASAETFTLPTVSELDLGESDHCFGIYTTNTLTGDFYLPGDSVNTNVIQELGGETHEVTLYARTVEADDDDYVNAVLDPNNGSAPMSDPIYEADCPTYLPDAAILATMGITQDGYHPVSFNTKADGKGTTLAFMQSLTFSELEALAVDGTVTIYVIWASGEGTAYDLTIVGNNGKVCTRSFSSADKTFTLPTDQEAFGEDAKSYGVYTDVSYKTYFCDMGDTVSTDTLIKLATQGDVVLFARMTKPVDENTYSLFYQKNAGDEYTKVEFNSTDESVTLKTIEELGWTNPGHSAVNFNSKTDGTGTSFEFGATVSPAALIALSEDGESLALYVIWQSTEVTYKGVLDSNNGTKETQEKDFKSTDGSFTLPDISEFGWTYTGYRTSGYNTEKDGTGTYYRFGQTVTVAEIIKLADEHNVATLYVQWDKIITSVTWNYDAAPLTIQYDYGSVIEKQADATRADTETTAYTFGGWTGYKEGMTAVKEAYFFEPIFSASVKKYTSEEVTEDNVLVIEPHSQEVNLSKDVVEQMKSDSTVNELAISLTNGSIRLDSTAIGELAETQKFELNVIDNDDLNEKMKETIGDRPVVALEFDGTEFSTPVTVSLDYEPLDGEDTSKLEVWYVKDDGSYEVISCTFADGQVQFSTTHNSYYSIMYKEPSNGGSDNMMLYLGIGAVIAVIAVAGVVFVMRRRA